MPLSVAARTPSPVSRPPRHVFIGRTIVLAALGLAGAQGAEGADSWNVTGGDVRARCRLTVGGSFDAVTSAISGTLRSDAADAASYPGALRVDLATLDSGIGLRNSHLRDNYLEVERGPEFRHAVLSGIRLEDPLPAGAGNHETAFAATLSLHGVRIAVEGDAELRRRNERIEVEATFPVSLEAFDIPPPRYLGVGVRDEVEITVAFDAVGNGTPARESPGGGSP